MSLESPSRVDSPTDASAGKLREALLVYAVTFLACAAVGLVGNAVPFIGANVLAFVAVLFLYLPLGVISRRGEDPAAFGVTSAGWPRGVAVASIAMLLVFPLFVGGYHVFHGLWLDHPPAFELDRLARWTPPLEGAPDLTGSDAVHLWTRGPALHVVGGDALDGEREVRVQPSPRCERAVGDVASGAEGGAPVVCRVHAGGGCRVDAPAAGWREVIVSSDELDTIRVGRRGDREALPIDATRGFMWWWTFIVIQLGLVALPEEVLYRGYLQTRLNSVWRRRWSVFGTPIGPGLLVVSVLFALGHLAIEPGFYRLAVFFPSLLFGWLRERSGTVVAPILFHAASNVLIQVVASFYYLS